MDTRTEALEALRNHRTALARELEDVDLAIETMGAEPGSNSKPQPNRSGRRPMPAGAKRAPSKPRIDICPQVRQALIDLHALTAETAHHANSVAKQTGTEDMPLLARTLKWLVHAGHVGRTGANRATQYYITPAGTEAFNGDGLRSHAEGVPEMPAVAHKRLKPPAGAGGRGGLLQCDVTA